MIPLVMGAGNGESPAPTIDLVSRAKMMSALAGLVILGVAMVLLIWLGARVTRRYMNPPNYDRQESYGASPHDDWARRQLSSGENHSQSESENDEQ